MNPSAAPEKLDVVVVGAGPAGSTCAISLLQAGVARVGLADRSRFPRDKACGDGFGPGVPKVLADLGLSHVLEGHAPIGSISVSSPSGRRVSGALPLVSGARPIGHVVPRKVFDNSLYADAVRLGARDMTGAELTGAAYDHGLQEWTLFFRRREDGDRVETVRAACLVGADGASSKVRRLLGVPMNDDAHLGMGIRAYASNPPAAGRKLEIDFVGDLLPAYGWVFPLGADAANVGIGIDTLKYKKLGRKPTELLDGYLAFLGPGAGFAVHEDSRLSYILPYGSQLPRLAHPDRAAALVGDAASMINPLTGEGIFYGMWAGAELGRELGTAIASGAPNGPALARYAGSFRRRFERHFHLNWRMKRKVSNPWWGDRVIAAADRDPKVLAELIDLMMGDLRTLRGRILLRIAWRSLFG